MNSSYSQLPKHGPLEGGPFLELCEKDAADLGVAQGAQARVWNDRGSMVAPVRITERLRPGVVVVPWGWWAADHEGDGNPSGQVANSLTNDTLTDWGGGVAFSDTRVAISPA